MSFVNRKLLSPDCANRDPFRGLPYDFPAGHSRFPIVPVDGYGDLSFDPSRVQNGDAEGMKAAPLTEEQRRRWREAVQQALGNLVEIRVDEER
jgi:hypothetical protein